MNHVAKFILTKQKERRRLQRRKIQRNGEQLSGESQMPLSGTVGGYTTGTNPITALAQTDVLAQIDKLKALIPDPTASVPAAHPDFDQISPQVATRLRAEIDALKVAIDATAVA